jgi:multiple sugar transport system substrate-binding protein
MDNIDSSMSISENRSGYTRNLKIFLFGITIALIVGVAVGNLLTRPTLPATRSDVSAPPVGEKPSITVMWAEWEPANDLRELSREFTRETGIEVNVATEPWKTYQDVVFRELDARGATYDLVVGDSQWLGRSSTAGHYVDLTRWVREHDVAESMLPVTIEGYAEYPKGSDRHWAVPLEGDAVGFAFRKDLFEDPKEMKAFRLKYGYGLDTPKTWAQMKDIAEFFTRPKDDLYGLTIWTDTSYDGITGGLNSLLFSFGGAWGDQGTQRVKGIMNSKESIEALEFYKGLMKYLPPDWKGKAYLEANGAHMTGRAAMTMNFFAFFPELVDPAKNPYADQTGFFAAPEGPRGRFTALGGQGISIISYSKKKEASLAFLEWLIRDDVQKRWAELGGFTCNKKVLASKVFLDAAPFNPALAESLGMLKDFWNVPEYADLLKVSQKHWGEYINGTQPSAKTAMDRVARDWENIFEYAGYYKE